MPTLVLLALPAIFLAPRGIALRAETHDLGRCEIVSFTARDADGDGRRDLVLLARDEETGALAFRALRQTERRTFEGEPLVFAPPEGALFHSIENVLAGVPGDEIVLGFEDRAEVRRFGAKSPLATIAFPGAPAVPSPGSLPRLDVARDVDGDGRIDLVLPGREGWLCALSRVDGSFCDPIEIAVPAESSLSTSPDRFLSLETTLPRLVVRDLDGDGLPETLHAEGTEIVGHRVRAGKTVRFRATTAPLPFLDPEETRDALQGATVALDDVDGDGALDLVAALQRGSLSIGSEISTTILHFPGGKDGFAAKPAQVLAVRGLALSVRLVDVDGDGARDLVVPTAETDLLSNVRKLLAQDISVSYQGFLFDPKARRFAAAPSFAETVPIPVSSVDRRESVPLASFDGDFDGDGAKDLLRIVPPTSIAVHRGESSRSLLGGSSFRFADEKSAATEARVSNSFSVEDLDGDGCSDVVFFGGASVTAVFSISEEKSR